MFKKNYVDKSQEQYTRKVVKSSCMFLSIILRFVFCLRIIRKVERERIILITATIYWHPSCVRGLHEIAFFSCSPSSTLFVGMLLSYLTSEEAREEGSARATSLPDCSFWPSLFQVERAFYYPDMQSVLTWLLCSNSRSQFPSHLQFMIVPQC